MDKYEDLRWAIGHSAPEEKSIPVNRDDLRALLAERDGLRMALSDAAMSLETIAEQSGRDEGMTAFSQVRGYANSRASVARIALKST